MSKLLFFIGGAAAIVAYFVANSQKQVVSQPVPVFELAHKLQDAWADHHTVV